MCCVVGGEIHGRVGLRALFSLALRWVFRWGGGFFFDGDGDIDMDIDRDEGGDRDITR